MDFYPPIDWTKHTLHAAAISANCDVLRRLIAAGADVNEQLDLDVNGQQDVAGSPLHVALRNCAFDQPGFAGGSDHCEAVRLLLEAGANVRARRRWEGTPLHDAARYGLVHIAELLIAHGADVDSTEDHEGRTPLHLAVADNRLKMVEFLIARGARLDVVAESKPSTSASVRITRRSAREKTPLQLAARDGHVAIVKRLLAAGASTDLSAAIELATESSEVTAARYEEVLAALQAAPNR